MYKYVTLAKWVDNPMEQINEMLLHQHFCRWQLLG